MGVDLNIKGNIISQTIVLQDIDWHTLNKNGRYRIIRGTHKPDNSANSTFLVDVFVMDSNYIHVTAHCLFSDAGNTGKIFECFKLVGQWQNWNEIGIATRSEANITLLNGYTTQAGYTSKVTKVGNTVKVLSLYINLTEGIKTAGTIITTVPTGYMPTMTHAYQPLITNAGTGYLTLKSNGVLEVAANSFPSGATWMIGSIIYI